MERREFVKAAGTAGLACVLVPEVAFAEPLDQAVEFRPDWLDLFDARTIAQTAVLIFDEVLNEAGLDDAPTNTAHLAREFDNAPVHKPGDHIIMPTETHYRLDWFYTRTQITRHIKASEIESWYLRPMLMSWQREIAKQEGALVLPCREVHEPMDVRHHSLRSSQAFHNNLSLRASTFWDIDEGVFMLVIDALLGLKWTR